MRPRSPLGKSAKAERTVRQPLILTLIAVAALGSVCFYASSISVYSSGWLFGGEAKIGSSLTNPSVGRRPLIADARGGDRSFAKRFSGKDAGSTSGS